ncbi:MAG: hypothetical protein AABY84_02120 [Candidatus Firestonebacteria bacterium]
MLRIEVGLNYTIIPLLVVSSFIGQIIGGIFFSINQCLQNIQQKKL